MNTTVLRAFLLVSLLLTWAPGYVVVAMRTKGEKEKLATPASLKTSSTNLIHALWVVVYLLWTFLVVLFLYNQESIHWFGRISLLDTDFVKVSAIAITCLAYYLPMGISILTLYKSINAAGNTKEGKTALITSGIYRYTRNPMYLAINVGVFATFLMIPNLLSLLVAVGMIALLYAVSFDEEKRLKEVYGEKYNKYKNDVGMIFPKINSIFSKTE